MVSIYHENLNAPEINLFNEKPKNHIGWNEWARRCERILEVAVFTPLIAWTDVVFRLTESESDPCPNSTHVYLCSRFPWRSETDPLEGVSYPLGSRTQDYSSVREFVNFKESILKVYNSPLVGELFGALDVITCACVFGFSKFHVLDYCWVSSPS